jgi:hypothetical protein
MYVAYIIVAAIFTVILAMSARMKLVREPIAVEVIGEMVGVPLRLFPTLAVLQIAGGAGLLIGIGLEPLGVAAAACLVLYFVVAIGVHVGRRVLAPGHVIPPVMMLAFAAAAMVLRLAA